MVVLPGEHKRGPLPHVPVKDDFVIQEGVYDPSAADPKDPYSGNVPYMIGGIPIADAVSFYYLSKYALHDPRTGKLRTCASMRGTASTGCWSNVAL